MMMAPSGRNFSFRPLLIFGRQVWRSLVFLNSIPVLLQEAWQCRTQVGIVGTCPKSHETPRSAEALPPSTTEQGFGPYIRDAWNALDVLTLSLLYASLAVSFNLPNAHRYFYLLSGTPRRPAHAMRV